MNARRIAVLVALLAGLAFFANSGCAERDKEVNIFRTLGGVTTDTGITVKPTPEQNLANAINLYRAGEYEKAIEAFRYVLITKPTQEEMAIAYAGIGWSKVRLSGEILDGYDDFENAYAAKSTVQDAKVGLASCYLNKDNRKISEGVKILESLGRGQSEDSSKINPNFVYVSEIGTGVKNSEVHALLGLLYYYNNQDALAKEQIDIAVTLDPTNETIKAIDEAVSTLGYGN